VYDEIQIGCSYRMDLVVEDAVIVEVKSVAKVERVHEAQMISYLKFQACELV